MILILRAVLIAAGLFFVLIGGLFLIDPARMAGQFGLVATGAQGLSSIRADVTGFFWLSGGSMIWGASARRGDLLLVAAALMGVALLGRTISLLAEGPYPGWYQSMVIEALSVVLALAGWRMIGRGPR
jgi:hypothetical protein